MTKAELMRKIQAKAFAKCEAELYLDCHPDSRQALDYFHKVTKELDTLTHEYDERYGPITTDGASLNRWNWVDDKWPWHKDFEEAQD